MDHIDSISGSVASCAAIDFGYRDGSILNWKENWFENNTKKRFSLCWLRVNCWCVGDDLNNKQTHLKALKHSVRWKWFITKWLKTLTVSLTIRSNNRTEYLVKLLTGWSLNILGCYRYQFLLLLFRGDSLAFLRIHIIIFCG